MFSKECCDIVNALPEVISAQMDAHRKAKDLRLAEIRLSLIHTEALRNVHMAHGISEFTSELNALISKRKIELERCEVG